MQKYPVHIVAVGGLVTNEQGQVLLLKSPRYDDWEFPGGQVEEGERLPQALEREVYEETGVKAKVNTLANVSSNTRKPPILIMDFLCEYISGELKTSEESLEVKWVHPNEALSLVKREAIYKRMKDMLAFSGEITYRAYFVDPYQRTLNYKEIEERKF